MKTHIAHDLANELEKGQNLFGGKEIKCARVDCPERGTMRICYGPNTKYCPHLTTHHNP